MIKIYFLILLSCLAGTEENVFVSENNDVSGRDKTSVHNFVARSNVIEKIRYDSAEQKSILSYVNYIRSNAVPQSTDMRMLVWSKNLVDLAEEWAEKCQVKFGPPGCRKNITQLIYNEPEEDSFTAVTPFVKWWKEKNRYNYSTNECVKGPCANYKKLVHSESHSIGCARTKCQTDGNATNFVVCNIYPVVNLKKKLYETEGFCKCSITRKERCKFMCYKVDSDCLPLCLHQKKVPDEIMECKTYTHINPDDYDEYEETYDDPSARSTGIMLINKVQPKILFSILIFQVLI